MLTSPEESCKDSHLMFVNIHIELLLHIPFDCKTFSGSWSIFDLFIQRECVPVPSLVFFLLLDEEGRYFHMNSVWGSDYKHLFHIRAYNMILTMILRKLEDALDVLLILFWRNKVVKRLGLSSGVISPRSTCTSSKESSCWLALGCPTLTGPDSEWWWAVGERCDSGWLIPTTLCGRKV